MKKVFLFSILLCCVSGSFAINGYSPYKLYVQNDTVTHVNLDSNIVRPSTWSLQIADTLDRRFVRFTDFTSHDSTLKYLNVDSLRSGPDIDTINGNTRFTGSPTVAGTVTAAGFSGPVTGAVTGNATTATTATNQSGGTVSATTGVFSGSVTINGTPGLHGTGTTNTLTKFTNGATGVAGDSHISDDGSMVTVTGLLTTTGNTAIGTTLKPWDPSYCVMQIGNSGFVMSGTEANSSKTSYFGNNTYFDGWTWRAINDGRGPFMEVKNGRFSFFSSDSVAEGEEQTVALQMTLDSLGQLGIGKTPTAPLDVAGLAVIDSGTIPILTGNVVTRGTHTATAFSGPLTGNVTGNASGSSGSCTGNAATSSSCTGNTSGSSGSCTGNAATVTNGVYTTGAGAVFLAPSGSAASLTSFPTLNQNTSGSSGSCTGNAATVTNGVYTTGAGTVFLAPSGSAASLTSFPTLNQSTTGNATTATTATNLSGGAVSGTTGTFSGLLTIDTIKSTRSDLAIPCTLSGVIGDVIGTAYLKTITHNYKILLFPGLIGTSNSTACEIRFGSALSAAVSGYTQPLQVVSATNGGARSYAITYPYENRMLFDNVGGSMTWTNSDYKGIQPFVYHYYVVAAY